MTLMAPRITVDPQVASANLLLTERASRSAPWLQRLRQVTSARKSPKSTG